MLLLNLFFLKMKAAKSLVLKLSFKVRKLLSKSEASSSGDQKGQAVLLCVVTVFTFT